jgi:predicted enzyme related to lactoylglutathione lyase
MGQPVVHFEIIGSDPATLRRFYGDLFGWEFDTSGPVAAAVSRAGDYGFVNPPSAWAGRAACPERGPGGPVVVGHFTDPEGNLVGVAAPAGPARSDH